MEQASCAKKQGAAAVIDDRRLRFKHVDAENRLDRLYALGRERLIDMDEIHREQRSRARHDVPEQQLGTYNLKDLKVRSAGSAASCVQGCQRKPGIAFRSGCGRSLNRWLLFERWRHRTDLFSSPSRNWVPVQGPRRRRGAR